jgi:hypothetical protein
VVKGGVLRCLPPPPHVALSTSCVMMLLWPFARSCPGPTFMSVSSFNTLSVTPNSRYKPNLNCKVIVHDPDGGTVVLRFTALYTELLYDCTYQERPCTCCLDIATCVHGTSP